VGLCCRLSFQRLRRNCGSPSHGCTSTINKPFSAPIPAGLDGSRRHRLAGGNVGMTTAQGRAMEIGIAGFLFWFTGGGTLCAVIASSRGRDAMVWFLVGAFFFIFAIIAVIALPPLRGARGASTTLPQPLLDKACPPLLDKACPRCAEIIKGAAIACRFCGYEYPGRKWSESRREPQNPFSREVRRLRSHLSLREIRCSR
jgi:hypothetical protein